MALNNVQGNHWLVCVVSQGTRNKLKKDHLHDARSSQLLP